MDRIPLINFSDSTAKKPRRRTSVRATRSHKFSPMLKQKSREPKEHKPITNKDLVERKNAKDALRIVQNFFRTALTYTEYSKIPIEFIDEVDFIKDLISSVPIENKQEVQLILKEVSQNIPQIGPSLKSRLESFAMVPEGNKRHPLPFLPKSEQRFAKETGKLTPKHLLALKETSNMSPTMQDIVFAFLLLLNEIDSSLDFLGTYTRMNLHILDCTKFYFGNPGHLIQKIREFPSAIRANKICYRAVKTAKKIVQRNENTPEEFEALMGFFHEFFRLFGLYRPLLSNKSHKHRDTSVLDENVKTKKSLSRDSSQALKLTTHRPTTSDISSVGSHNKLCKAVLLKRFLQKNNENSPARQPFNMNTRCNKKLNQRRSTSGDYSHLCSHTPNPNKFPIENMIRKKNSIMKENRRVEDQNDWKQGDIKDIARSRKNSLDSLHLNFSQSILNNLDTN